MDLYVIGLGLKLYIINRACGGVPLAVATHVATNFALSATWWTTKQAVGLVGSGLVGTYRLLSHSSASGNGPRTTNSLPIQEDWEEISGDILPSIENLAATLEDETATAKIKEIIGNADIVENIINNETTSSTDNKNCFSELEASYIIIDRELDISNSDIQ
jgi:hypothetical protein